MRWSEQLNIQYITDHRGKKTAVILPIEQFHELLEDIEDLVVIAERKHDSTLPHQQVLDEFRQDGLQF